MIRIKELDEPIKIPVESYRIDTSIKVERPPAILTIKETEATQTVFRRVLTAGNISVIKGKRKARKTFFTTLVCGTLLAEPDYDGILINEMSENKNEVVYFDTEQSQYDSYMTIKRIENIARNRRIKGYNLRKLNPVERCDAIEQYLLENGKKTGCVVIDGVRDLVTAINSEDEATRVSSLLLKWTDVYQSHIIIIIHENKADGNSRGHIGTEVENKAEIVISVEKDEKNWRFSTVKCALSRGLDFKDFEITVDENGLPYVEGYKPENEILKTEMDVPF